MKKFISYILIIAIMLCGTVAFADEKQVVIDTEVPIFEDLEDGSSYIGSKDIKIADLSTVKYVIMKAGTGTVTFNGQTFTGYTKITEGTTECINFTKIYTVSGADSYLVYAADEYGHDIAVRFKIVATGSVIPSGGGGGGGGAPTVVEQPYINGNPKNTGGEIVAGTKVIIETETGKAKIYYTTTGRDPNTNSINYIEGTELVLEKGQVLKALAYKNGVKSEISEWKVVGAKEEEPNNPSIPSNPSEPGIPSVPNTTESLVSGMLITDEHVVYMAGYPDGEFFADNNMTRAEVAVMFSRLMKEQPEDGVTYESSFTDVEADSWHYNAVGYMVKNDIITGYEDGSFKPDNTITRAEFMTIASRFAELDEKEFTCDFDDLTEEHWAYKYVAFAAGNNWIGGYEDGTVKPDNTITRAEVVTIVNNMLVRDADKEYIKENASALTSFIDIDSEHWAYYDIMEATNEHKYTVDGDMEKWN